MNTPSVQACTNVFERLLVEAALFNDVLCLGTDDDVSRGKDTFLINLPDVQFVHLLDIVDPEHIFQDLVRRHVGRRRLQQNCCRISSCPRFELGCLSTRTRRSSKLTERYHGNDDAQGDEHAKGWIGVSFFWTFHKQCDDTNDDNTNRVEGVSQYMHKDAGDGKIHLLLHSAFRCSMMVAGVLLTKSLAQRNTVAIGIRSIVGVFVEDGGAYDVECESN